MIFIRFHSDVILSYFLNNFTFHVIKGVRNGCPCIVKIRGIYSISQEICTRSLLCFALLWLYIDWFSHIHQAYFTGTVALQSNGCPSASKATLMNMNKYFTWIHYERLHNHNKAKHNKTVCIFLGIYCRVVLRQRPYSTARAGSTTKAQPQASHQPSEWSNRLHWYIAVQLLIDTTPWTSDLYNARATILNSYIISRVSTQRRKWTPK